MGDTIIEKDSYEDEDGQAFKLAREAVNTPEEIKIADKYTKIHLTRKEELKGTHDRWKALQELYSADEDYDDVTEYGFVNVILPTVEGQVSALTNQNVSATFRGKGISDQKFARAAEVIFPSIFSENNIRQKLKRASRRYTLFGNMVIKIQWDAEAWDGFGIPEYRAIPLDKIFFDGKVKDMIDYQRGAYCIEEIPQTIEWVKENYDNGEELANAITLGNTEASFDAELTGDDDENFTMLEVWRKAPGTKKLQKIEISRCGVLLSISDPKEPYFKKVHNKYPYFPAGLYSEEGEFYCFGDGQLAKPVQTILSNLYHEVILACKFAAQRRTFIDPLAKVDPADFDGDPSHPIMAKNPHQFIYDQQGAGINQVVLEMINHLLVQVEKMTRFSALMTGNGTGEKMTATQAGIQQTQGVSGVDDKKADISKAFGDATLYALGLCMELWPGGKAFRITEDSEDFEWVDIRELSRIPEMVPADEEYKKRFRGKGHKKENIPQFMQLEYDAEEQDDDGNPMFEMDEDGITPKLDEMMQPVKKMKKVMATKQVELDITVSIGEGLPTNKMALYNIILTLAQLNLPDERTGQLRPLLSYKQVKTMVEDYIGIKIEDYLDNPPVPQPQQPGQAPAQPGTVNMDPNIPGANMSGQMGGSANVIA